ncbi:hypothetical protein DPMN_127565 [Dreissena polymorpha]|uniref:Uncharacterized protein n=1 Tax=Dreissena polymorpha TaxID=45954 RepID=A0A9D4GY03_DREPO|nr:hypothetical protein DPMN_127565 [Dreissena polymorpha]
MFLNLGRILPPVVLDVVKCVFRSVERLLVQHGIRVQECERLHEDGDRHRHHHYAGYCTNAADDSPVQRRRCDVTIADGGQRTNCPPPSDGDAFDLDSLSTKKIKLAKMTTPRIM